MKSRLMLLACALICSGCTYSITMMHSEGSTDSLDEQQTSNPNISPNLSIPAKVV